MVLTNSVGNASPYTQTVKIYMTEAAVTTAGYEGLEINNTGTKLRIINNSQSANPIEIILIKK